MASDTVARVRVRVGYEPDGGYEVHGESYPKEGWRSRVEESEWTFEVELVIPIPPPVAELWQAEADDADR